MSATTAARHSVDRPTVAIPAVRVTASHRAVSEHFVTVAQVMFGLLIGSQAATLVLTTSPATAAHTVLLLALCTFGLAVLLLTVQVARLVAELHRTREGR